MPPHVESVNPREGLVYRRNEIVIWATSADCGQPILIDVSLAKASGNQTSDKKLSCHQIGLAQRSASLSGCHSKKPLQVSLAEQVEQALAYFCFQSEIERTAKQR